MDNTIIKITDGAVRSQVLVLDNVPTHPFNGMRHSVHENKALRKLRVDYATAYFQQQARLQAEQIAFRERLASAGIALPPLAPTPVSLLSAVQQAIIQTNGTPTHKQEKYRQGNYAKRQGLRNDAIWDIVQNNFSPTNTAFATLTFNPQTTTNSDVLDVALRYFRNFIIRVNRKLNHFQYVAVYARQKSKRWHFHLFYNAPFLTNMALQDMWGLGIVHTNRSLTPEDVRHKTQYLLKNLHQNQDELQGRKGYLYCKNLRRSIVMKSWNPDQADQCMERFEQLSLYDSKYLVYDAEHPSGATVRLEYPDGSSKDVFLTQDDLLQTEDPLIIIDQVQTHVSSVVVYHDEGQAGFITATPKQ